MFCRHHHSCNFPSSGPAGVSAKSSSSSSSQFIGVKKREDLPGFDSDEGFNPVKGYSHPSLGDGGSSGPAYSVSSFSTGDTAGFSTHVKHDVPRRGEAPSQETPEFYYPSPEKRLEPSRLFSSYFAQDEPAAEFREASESSNDEKQLEEIRKHMRGAERSSAFDVDDEDHPGGVSEAQAPSAETSSFNEEGPSPSQNSEHDDDGVGCKNCNYAQFQMDHS